MSFQSNRSVPAIFGAICFAAFYLIGQAFWTPMPRYLPVEHVWSLAPPKGTIAMSYYSFLLNGALGGVIGVVAGMIGPVQRKLMADPFPAILEKFFYGLFGVCVLYSVVSNLVVWGMK